MKTWVKVALGHGLFPVPAMALAMSVKTDNQVKLSDGHSVGYAEYGDPMGKPVLHFHGFPSSRFEGHRPTMDEIATRLHARVIVVERPGIGLSDYKPYTIASWPDIVMEFADALRLDRFAVMGVSSGGKYVAACASKIPQRIRACADRLATFHTCQFSERLSGLFITH
jgi:pimeloyl-ACP methyl ester carboxylesterase